MGRRQRGGIITGWLLRLALALTVLGVLGHDALALSVARVAVKDQAAIAVRAASEAWQVTHNVQHAYDAAVTSAVGENPDNVVEARTFRVDADGTAHLRVQRTARTLLMRRWSVTDPWTRVTADAAGRAVT